ncbi:TIGR03936 family radical SAM-associated protein [Sedimentibacter sp.]|uniref:TIGR03936 family radical SAM-associated protein n=1 Tax=Sedimentibacter sp. TaxID=1960295 RepID=UPI0028A12470|nr:TIGR03936 family radical SAM-associated protein [Sedimentibacter sp.]
MSLIVKYTKTGNLKYISHLDVLRFIQRAVKRAGINAKYSEGFNPHMKTSFGFPLSLGIESIGEYFEIELNEDIKPDDFVNKMNSVLPKEMQVLKAAYSDDSRSLMSRSSYTEYLFNIELINSDFNKLNNLIKEIVETGIVFIKQKKNKKNKMVTKEYNTKDFITYLNAIEKPGKIVIESTFITAETGSMKPSELIKVISDNGFSIEYHTILKVETLDENKKPIL